MKKEKKKHSKKFTIITTCAISSGIIALSVAAGMWFGFVDPALCSQVNYDSFYTTWMKNVKDDAKIADIVMPGSHDAGTFGIMPQARCQGHDIITQLNSGVRYFDIRVTDRGNDLVIFHGPIMGQDFKEVADDFNEFILANPSEFVVIDFQHIGDSVHQQIIDMVKEKLPMDKMLPSGVYKSIDKVDMSLLRENKYNFMITWNDKSEAEANDFYTRSESLRSEYNGSKHKESNEALINEFETYYNNAEANKLFVLQAQRTAKTLLGKPSMYEKNFKDDVNKFIANIKNDAVKLDKTNIIMRDFIISDKENLDTILSLNLNKNLIKADAIQTYSSFVL